MKTLFLLLFFAQISFGQTISGRINDTHGKPIFNVLVQLKHQKTKTITDEGGTFTLPLIDINDTLIFSHVAYLTHVIAVKDFEKKDKVITLTDNSQQLQTVYVTNVKAKKFGYTPHGFILLIPPFDKQTNTDAEKIPVKEQLAVINIPKKLNPVGLSFYLPLSKTSYKSLTYQIHFYRVENNVILEKLTQGPIYYTLYADTSKIGLKQYHIDLRPFEFQWKGYSQIAVGFELMHYEFFDEHRTDKPSFTLQYASSNKKPTFYRDENDSLHLIPKRQLAVTLYATTSKQNAEIQNNAEIQEDTENATFNTLLQSVESYNAAQRQLLGKYFSEYPQSKYDQNNGKFIPIDSAKIYYESYGKGEPLILLHGNSASIAYFYKQIPELSKHYQVIGIDTRGQGKSTDESHLDYTYERFADDLKTVMDSLHIAKAHLLGWSDGGNTALIMGYRHPEYVKSIIASGAVLSPEGIEPVVLKHIEDAHRAEKIMTGHNTRLEKILLQEPHITTVDLKKIKCKTLIIAGDHDVVTPQHTKTIAENIPHSELLFIKNATHYPAWEQTKVFNNAVLKFLNQK